MVTVQTLSGGLSGRDVSGRLWIVQTGRIREYQEDLDNFGDEGWSEYGSSEPEH